MKQMRMLQEADSFPPGSRVRGSGGGRTRRDFCEDERSSIIEQRGELARQGMKDWRIANVLAERLRRSAKSVEGEMRRLAKEGRLGENPNAQVKHRRGFDVAGARAKLMGEGLCDGAIAKEIARETGRSVASVKTTISALVSRGTLQPNPNNQKEAEPDELRWLLNRCHELSSIGLTRHSISHVLACECERGPQAIRRMIWELEREGFLTEAKANRRKSAEMRDIITGRDRLMKEGKSDAEIAREMARGMKRRPETIGLLIYRAVNSGGCPKNPN